MDPNAVDPLAGSLSHADRLVLVWQSLATLPEAAELADINRHAVALLALLGALDEPPPPPEESPQLAAHLHRLDQKLDLLLNLTGQWLRRELALPASQPLRLGCVAWSGRPRCRPGRAGADQRVPARRVANGAGAAGAVAAAG